MDLSAPSSYASAASSHVPVLFRRTELKIPHVPEEYETKQVRKRKGERSEGASNDAGSTARRAVANHLLYWE